MPGEVNPPAASPPNKVERVDEAERAGYISDMSEPTMTTCATCGAAGSGLFCSACGTPRGEAQCPSCKAPITRGARFCASCGHWIAPGRPGPRLVGQPPQDRTPWVVAGISLAVMLGLLLFTLVRQAPARPGTTPALAGAVEGETPPDLSTMTPRERFNRLYNRIMRGTEAGDQATVARFTPMALLAYAQLDTVDADARFHAALLRVHTGDTAAARALGDSVLAQNPTHLFGYVILGTAARWAKDDRSLRRAYDGFLRHYDAEMKAGREEYGEHTTSLADFRRAALDTRSKPAAGP